MVREQDFAATHKDGIEQLLAYQRLQMINLIVPGEDVISLRPPPELLELAVVDKYVCGPGSIRAIDHIKEPSVQKQRSPVGIEENGREPVVVVVND